MPLKAQWPAEFSLLEIFTLEYVGPNKAIFLTSDDEYFISSGHIPVPDIRMILFLEVQQLRRQDILLRCRKSAKIDVR